MCMLITKITKSLATKKLADTYKPNWKHKFISSRSGNHKNSSATYNTKFKPER